tara:strand:+ start:169 stop:666 length:498 start_codon:yes stop_codon:yes gene_type:complete
MSYKVDKFSLFQYENNPSAQEISTTYTEITGSKCEIKSINQNPKLLYKFTFMASTIFYDSSNYNIHFLHVKLQKSNDNFSSNIVDVPNCTFNISADTNGSPALDVLWKTCTPMFILENFDSNYLRLVTRSYSTSNKARLHTASHYDGVTNPSNIYYNPSLIVMEL